jgi:hypothetical protein
MVYIQEEVSIWNPSVKANFLYLLLKDLRIFRATVLKSSSRSKLIASLITPHRGK